MTPPMMHDSQIAEELESGSIALLYLATRRRAHRSPSRRAFSRTPSTTESNFIFLVARAERNLLPLSDQRGAAPSHGIDGFARRARVWGPPVSWQRIGVRFIRRASLLCFRSSSPLRDAFRAAAGNMAALAVFPTSGLAGRGAPVVSSHRFTSQFGFQPWPPPRPLLRCNFGERSCWVSASELQDLFARGFKP